MVNKIVRFFAFVLIFGLAAALFAQEKASVQTFDNAGGENAENSGTAENLTEEWQILEWQEDEPLFVLKYEVIIEKYNPKKDVYTEINRLITETNTTSIQIKPYLVPGAYRFKVITYNLLGVPEVESEWQPFNIFQAYQPGVNNVVVNINHSSTIYLDDINDGKLTVTGRNLFTGPEDDKDISFTTYSLDNINGKKSYIPEITEFSDNNHKLEVQLDMNTLDVGHYNFIARDASGLSNEKNLSSSLNVKFRKMMDFDISAGYACPVVLFDDTIETFMGEKAWPLSGIARMTFVPVKRRYGFYGIGLCASYTRMFKEFDSYSIDGNFITGHLDFVYQIPFYSKANAEGKRRHNCNLELHAGAGVSFFNQYMFHFPHNIDSDPLNSISLSINAGALAQIYITQRLFIEPSADYIMTVSDKNNFGFIIPGISIGRQF